MFYFVAIDNSSKSASYDKGKLFEGLVAKLLRACGYTEDLSIRTKEAGLEYDITGRHAIEHHNVVGEAKAYTRKISDEILSFYGKMAIHWKKSKRTLGLFISTSDLTPDVANHMREVEGEQNFQYICGSMILDKLHETIGYLKFEQVKKLAESQFPDRYAGDTALVVTDRGEYFVQLLIDSIKTRAQYFCIINSSGQIIDDKEFARTLTEHIDIIKELQFVASVLNETIVKTPEESSGFMEVLRGSGWFDYQLPAAPDKFVGREKVIDSILDRVNNIDMLGDGTRIFEIKSRSGVGKSSLCVKIDTEIKQTKHISVLIDSRNIRHRLDLTSVCQLIAREVSKISGVQMELPKSLQEFSINLKQISRILIDQKRLLVVLIDQIESLFLKPDVFDCLVDFILECTYVNKRHVIVIARKDDLTTTHDEALRVDVGRLSSLATPIHLQDFNLEEAKNLVDKIPEVVRRPLRSDLRKDILEFASGFPWLLKKTCAHVIDLIRKGVHQEDIKRDGLRLHELFNDEIMALDEVTRDFLKRLVAFLPATQDELIDSFDPTENVPAKLNRLQYEHRLIRLSGRTFDTYNDVFKEFVKTNKVPHLRRYPFRFTATPCIKLFEQLCSNPWVNINEVASSLNFPKGVVYNYLRELTQLGVVDLRNGQIVVEEAAKRAYEDDEVITFFKSKVKQNALVRDVLNKLALDRKIARTNLGDFLKEALPFTEAADKTWTNYADKMGNWLKTVGLASYKNKVISISKGSTKEEEVDYPSGLPSAHMQQVVRLVDRIKDGHEISRNALAAELKRGLTNLLIPCRSLGLIEKARGTIRLTEAGIKFAQRDEAYRKQYVKKWIFENETLRSLILSVQEKEDTSASQLIAQGFKELGIEWDSPTTHAWRIKLVANWLDYAGLIYRVGSKRKGTVTISGVHEVV